jgi:hypothetical protein
MVNNIMKKILRLLICISAVLTAQTVYAGQAGKTAAQLIENATAEDMPYDSGGDILLRWPVDKNAEGIIYEIYAYNTINSEKNAEKNRKWKLVDSFPAFEKTADRMRLPFWAWKHNAGEYAVKISLNSIDESATDGTAVEFIIKAVKNGKTVAESRVLEAVSEDNWFNLPRLNGLIMVIIITTAFFITVSRARKQGLFIRRIAGLDAIDEAIGRATEMGKPVFYSTGISGISGVNTIASLSILGEVSRKIAEYDSLIKIPHYDPVVMSVAKETVKQAYIEAGRPDSYRDSCNFFLSSDQFSYAASLDGMIEREKPAACFFMGYFLAESLLLTEVGAATGAIQIAATDSESQLPFFFTSCDYTLIGEELYAAGAYLSREPMLLSVLKLQDFGKLFMMISVIAGGIAVAAAAALHCDAFVNGLLNLFTNY